MTVRALKANAAKTAADGALSATGQTFAWSGKLPVTQGVDYVKASDLVELRGAIDLAHNNINTGCAGHYSTNYIDDLDRSDNGTYDSDYIDKSHDSYCSDKSNDSIMVSSNNTGNYTDYVWG